MLFTNSLADSPQIAPCRSGEDKESIIPEKYMWREEKEQCGQTVQDQGNCSASYAMATVSTAADRICHQTNKKVSFSSQEIINCDKANYHCEGGYVTRALNWGKRKGLLAETCHEWTGKFEECGDDYKNNECRLNNEFYKVNDWCLAQEEQGIKREIMAGGPVIAQIQVYTDFLTYSEGIYHRTEDAFKFNGQHIVKIIGWDKSPEGADFWLIENTWGTTWGEEGFAKISMQDKSIGLDYYALGLSTYPMTMAELYTMQENQMKMDQMKEEEGVNIDMDEEAAEIIQPGGVTIEEANAQDPAAE